MHIVRPDIAVNFALLCLLMSVNAAGEAANCAV